MLLNGGSAVDAALATAITLTVVEPWVNGIGGDLFAMVWDGVKLHGLNGSGRAPATHTPELFERLGLTEVPARGWLPVTVPGAPAAWSDLHRRFGKLEFSEIFGPIDYAEEGWPVAPVRVRVEKRPTCPHGRLRRGGVRRLAFDLSTGRARG
jgi:gamma-glutamyltranspeptidase/glutathione hydrolase